MEFYTSLQQDVLGKTFPRNYGFKSAVHRFHLYLCEYGTYQKLFNEFLNKSYDLNKIDLYHCFTDIKDVPAKIGETSVMMATRK